MVEAKFGILHEDDIDKDSGRIQSETERAQERRRQHGEGLALFADCVTSRTKNRRNVCTGQAPWEAKWARSPKGQPNYLQSIKQ